MTKYLKASTFLILALVGLANILLWAGLNRPILEKPWAGTFKGLAYAPYRSDQDPTKGAFVAYGNIDEDLRFLQDKTSTIRTYTALDGTDQVPRIAAKYGLKVTAGAWISPIAENNEREIQSLIWIANHNPNVEKLLVGNEALLREDVTAAQLIDYLKRVKAKTNTPLSTAEPWHVWLKHPELARAVDYIAVHILPYWEGQPLDHSMEFILEKYRLLQRAYPGKHIVVTEVGWPSDGRIKKKAVPSLENQAVFLRRFLDMAQRNDLDYSIMEAFDQPWKRHLEGSVGSYWGIFDNDREWKSDMTGPILAVPEWPLLAACSTLIGFGAIAFALGLVGALRTPGRLFLAGTIQAVATTGVWAVHVATNQYLSAGEIVIWVMLGTGLALLMAILLVEALELAESFWLSLRRKPAAPPPEAPPAGYLPKVSIHIPICNEPPHMVIESLEALARLDYPDFEVLVIDNNTSDSSLWLPVQAWCAGRDHRFRFFHLDKCPGFKAGALNYALNRTAPDAVAIGVIDSDYTVRPDWLKTLAPRFAEPNLAFVQGPQDYRDWQAGGFKEMCNWEYIGFFHVGMELRNERNAIIQHGTMTLIRRAALEELGGWAEWCITEDAELGLRLFARGYESLYLNRSFGLGVTPDSFAGYKSQRFRWAYGAVQILKRHWRAFLGRGPGKLTPGQRFDFIAGWLPWFGDALNLVFTFCALIWTLGLVFWPKHFDFPLSVFVASALGLFAFKAVKSYALYAWKLGTTFKRNIGAAVAGLALTHSVGKAVWSGLFTSDRPFLRTPKCEDQPAFVQGLAMAREEAVLGSLLWVAAGTVVAFNTAESPEAWLWAAMLVVQSLPYGAAVLTALISAMPQRHAAVVPAAAPALASDLIERSAA